MTPDKRTKGPAYFGKMAAAMSHELKNCLAIMNENNGLVQDFTHLARSGRPLDPDRLSQVAERIDRQIVRADNLLKEMNRFAHSVDRPQQQVDLYDGAVLASRLGARLAANRQVEIRIDAPDTPVTLTLSFFLFLNLAWQTMEGIMSAMEAETVLGVTVFKEGKAPCLGFESSGPLAASVESDLEAADVHQLSAGAGARIEVQPDQGRVTLIFDTQTIDMP